MCFPRSRLCVKMKGRELKIKQDIIYKYFDIVDSVRPKYPFSAQQQNNSTATYLPVRKDGALVSVEDIPNDRLEGRLEDIFLRRKACKDVVEFVARLDLP
jgi:hypothetical protein